MGSPNVHKINAGEIQAGYVGTEQLVHSLAGSGTMADIGIPRMRFIAWGHATFWHFITKDPKIKSPFDFKGKKLMTVLHGAETMRLYTEAVLETYGMNPKNEKIMEYGSGGEVMDSLKEGTADVILRGAGIPNAAIAELAQIDNVYLVSHKEAELKALLEKYPAHGPALTIPAGTYKGQNSDIICGTLMSALVVHRDLPDSFVYELMKAIFDHNKELAAVHPSGNEYTLARGVADIQFPFHAAAIKYYKEKGGWTAEKEAEHQRLLKVIGEKK